MSAPVSAGLGSSQDEICSHSRSNGSVRVRQLWGRPLLRYLLLRSFLSSEGAVPGMPLAGTCSEVPSFTKKGSWGEASRLGGAAPRLVASREQRYCHLSRVREPR